MKERLIREREGALKALPQPMHLYEYLTRSRHYHFGSFDHSHDTLDEALDRMVLDFVKHLLPGGSVLDIGCGMGGTSSLLANLGFPVLGIDPCSEAIHYANQNLIPDERLTFERRGFHEILTARSSRRFDHIVMIEILQHVPSLEVLLRGCSKLIRPGGALIIHDVVTIPALPWADVPFHRFGALRSAAMDAGLEVMKNRVITEKVKPTLSHLIDQIQQSRKEALKFFDGSNRDVKSEIEELIRQWQQLEMGFTNGDLAYETWVLKYPEEAA